MEEKLKKLLENSYAKYSNYRVAAIVETNDGTLFSGVNVENASFGATICAERVALTAAITNGYRNFKTMYIMVDSDKIPTPCFICRQVFVELCSKDMKIVCMNNKGDKKTFTVEELCPHPFTKENL